MNKQIKELAVQADLLIKKTNGDEFRYGNFDPKFQKFAELIVQECVDTLNKRFMGDLNREDMEVRRCIEDVKKHFGVEE